MQAKIKYTKDGKTQTAIGELRKGKIYIHGRLFQMCNVLSYELMKEEKDHRELLRHCINTIYTPAQYFYVSKSRKREHILLKHAGIVVLLNHSNVMPVDIALMFNRSRESCYHARKRICADKVLFDKYGIETELLNKYRTIEKMFLSLAV
jgi:hypothetical protein